MSDKFKLNRKIKYLHFDIDLFGDDHIGLMNTWLRKITQFSKTIMHLPLKFLCINFNVI